MAAGGTVADASGDRNTSTGGTTTADARISDACVPIACAAFACGKGKDGCGGDLDCGPCSCVGLAENSAEALGVLLVANGSDATELASAGLTAARVKAILDPRQGSDGVPRTSDDDLFQTLADLIQRTGLSDSECGQLLARAKEIGAASYMLAKPSADPQLAHCMLDNANGPVSKMVYSTPVTKVITDYRNGPDGIEGTADDRVFQSYQDLRNQVISSFSAKEPVENQMAEDLLYLEARCVHQFGVAAKAYQNGISRVQAVLCKTGQVTINGTPFFGYFWAHRDYDATLNPIDSYRLTVPRTDTEMITSTYYLGVGWMKLSRPRTVPVSVGSTYGAYISAPYGSQPQMISESVGELLLPARNPQADQVWMNIDPTGATDCRNSVTYDLAIFPTGNVCKAGGTFTAWRDYCCSGTVDSGLPGNCSYRWRGDPCPADGACASGHCVDDKCAFPSSCPAAGTALCTACGGDSVPCVYDGDCCSNNCRGTDPLNKYCTKPTGTRPPESPPKCTAPACGTWVGAVLGGKSSVTVQVTESGSGSTYDLEIVSPSTGSPYVSVDNFHIGDLDVGTGLFVIRQSTDGYRGVVHPDGASLTHFKLPQ